MNILDTVQVGKMPKDNRLKRSNFCGMRGRRVLEETEGEENCRFGEALLCSCPRIYINFKKRDTGCFKLDQVVKQKGTNRY